MAKGHKVMLIDDDTGMRGLLYDTLTKKGYDVTSATGGEQALQLMSKSRPDLIVLDYCMPGMSGLAFLKRLRSFDTELPVIMLTSFDEEILEHEAKKLGVSEFLRKGVGSDLFIDSINRFVDPKRLAQASRPSKGFIMVVDDDPEIREMLKKFLTKKDYDVVCVENAEKALVKIKERKLNLIILDINLPGMDGLTALKKFKEIDKSLGVIMISGNTDVELAKEALKLGATDFVMKPFNLEYLESSVFSKIFLGES
jgi:two-component system CheB/CheR fusion protein